MKKLNMAIALAFLNAMAFAQEKIDANVNLDVDKGGSGAFPWMWVVGAILLLVVLFALLGGRGGSDRVVERHTVIKD